MEDSSLSPCHYRLILFSCSRFQLLPADRSEDLPRIVVFFLFCKRMDQRQYLLADYDQCLHLPQRGFLPRFQVMIKLFHLVICRNHYQRHLVKHAPQILSSTFGYLCPAFVFPGTVLYKVIACHTAHLAWVLKSCRIAKFPQTCRQRHNSYSFYA